MVTQHPGGLDYPGPTRYVLRRRERSSLWAIFFMVAFPVPFLTMAVYGWVIRYSSVVEVIYFGLFFLGMIWCGRDTWKDRAAVAGQVLLAVGDAGVYLGDPPRLIPWAEVAGLVMFRTLPEDHDGDSAEWLSRLAVVRPGEECLPGAVARQLSSPDQWGAVVELHDERSSGSAPWPKRCTPMRPACRCGTPAGSRARATAARARWTATLRARPGDRPPRCPHHASLPGAGKLNTRCQPSMTVAAILATCSEGLPNRCAAPCARLK